MTRGRGRCAGWRGAVVGMLVTVAVAGCDDQIKYVPTFSTMSTQPSLEAYEEGTPRPPAPGTMPIDGARTYTLVEADTALSNPLAGTEAELGRGETLYGTFCAVCHGASGTGDGSVVGPNRIPPLPLLDVASARTANYSDGYLWGMITNGRGLMPSYRRIPAADRWLIVSWLRQLQGNAGNLPAAGGASAADGSIGAGGDR